MNTTMAAVVAAGTMAAGLAAAGPAMAAPGESQLCTPTLKNGQHTQVPEGSVGTR